MSDEIKDVIEALGKAFEGTFWGFNKIELLRTSSACPEQYDLLIDSEKAGYFRLRHGEFRVDFPDCGDETIYESDAMNGEGLFQPEERGRFLCAGIEAAINKWTSGKQNEVSHAS